MSLEQQIASRIEEYLPDLRKQIRLQISKHLSKTNKQILEEKTSELRELYTAKLRDRAQAIKQNINSNLKNMNEQVGGLQADIASIKARKLTEQEKSRIVEDTVEEIAHDTHMMDEIKLKLYPKVEESVFQQLEQQLCADLEEFQAEQQATLDAQRTAWETERYQHWRAQSERDIEVLSQEHRELECKKTLIQQSLGAKKSQRDSLVRQQQKLVQTNTEISYLKAQIKLLS